MFLFRRSHLCTNIECGYWRTMKNRDTCPKCGSLVAEYDYKDAHTILRLKSHRNKKNWNKPETPPTYAEKLGLKAKKVKNPQLKEIKTEESQTNVEMKETKLDVKINNPSNHYDPFKPVDTGVKMFYNKPLTFGRVFKYSVFITGLVGAVIGLFLAFIIGAIIGYFVGATIGVILSPLVYMIKK